MSIQVCRDTSDAVALYLPQRLYLKSYAKLNISVQLPAHKVHGKSISNWELMEKLRKMIQPDSFSVLKVSKHSSEVIRFDAELENRGKLERVLSRLEGRIIQLNDYPDPLKVRVSEAKSDYPTRHSWDSFFRDATDMDEMKPGERPDTVHVRNLPIRWFVHFRDRDDEAPPSEAIFKKVFEKYGSICQVDVPAADPFRLQMKEAMRGITTPASEAQVYFEGYIQFSEYVSFVRCMDALRGRKLLRKNEDLAEWCSIHVDFDKTKHMTDAAVKRRAIVRERLSARRRAVEDEERLEKDRIAKREAKERERLEQCQQEKLAKMREREERRKRKQLAKLMERDDVDLAKNITEEQRRLLKAQKRLQAIRLIEELFKRIELRPDLQRNSKHARVDAGERAARARVVDSFRQKNERAYEEQRERLKQALDGRIIIRSALETKKPKRESSISSISSEEVHKRVKTEKLSTPEREMEYNRTAGMYALPNPYGFGYPYPAVPPGYPFQTLYYGARGGYAGGAYAGAGAYAAAGGAYGGAAPYGDGYVRRPHRGRGRGRGRGPRMPYFDGPDASQQYYQYFKKLTETEHHNNHDDRRSRSRSRSRSRRRSYSRSRSRRRSCSRSRSRGRGRRSRSRRSRSRRSSSSRSRSRSRRTRSHSRSKSRRKSRSRSKRTRSKTRSKSRGKSPTAAPEPRASPAPPARSRSWSLPKDSDGKSWSKSPKK